MLWMSDDPKDLVSCPVLEELNWPHLLLPLPHRIKP